MQDSTCLGRECVPGPVPHCPLVPVTTVPVVASQLSIYWELERQLDLERQIPV